MLLRVICGLETSGTVGVALLVNTGCDADGGDDAIVGESGEIDGGDDASDVDVGVSGDVERA